MSIKVQQALLSGPLLGGVLLLLSHCATKHQPTIFPLYFPEGPRSVFGASQVEEQRALRSKKVLTPWEKRRLIELNTLELVGIRSDSKRKSALLAENQALNDDTVAPLQRALESLPLSNKKLTKADRAEPSHTFWQSVPIKRAYMEAQRLWNQDKSKAAREKIMMILSQDSVWKAASDRERLRVLNLRFRITAESGDPKLTDAAFQDLKKQESCAPETSKAAFLFSLILFQAGEATRAFETLRDQCDKEESAGTRMKKAYWLARFSESIPNPAESYVSLLQSPIPGYYSFLAQARVKRNLEVRFPVYPSALQSENPTPLEAPFMVSSEVAQWIGGAENSIAAHLYRDALSYLDAAAANLKSRNDHDSLIPLLHVASLYQAAGNHLEAMKIYSLLFVNFSFGEEKSPVILGRDLFTRIFPSPFQPQVEWLAKLWKIEPDLVYAIMRQESAFNPVAVSPTNARGLMQLEPPTARYIATQWKNQGVFTEQSLFAAEENLKIAAFYLRQLQESLPHPLLVAAAYNAGFARVRSWTEKYGQYPLDIFIEMIPYEETCTYVKLVLRNYVYYKTLRTGKAIDGSFLSSVTPVGIPMSHGFFPGGHVAAGALP